LLEGLRDGGGEETRIRWWRQLSSANAVNVGGCSACGVLREDLRSKLERVSIGEQLAIRQAKQVSVNRERGREKEVGWLQLLGTRGVKEVVYLRMIKLEIGLGNGARAASRQWQQTEPRLGLTPTRTAKTRVAVAILILVLVALARLLGPISPAGAIASCRHGRRASSRPSSALIPALPSRPHPSWADSSRRGGWSLCLGGSDRVRRVVVFTPWTMP
jgi:hypothetical protein